MKIRNEISGKTYIGKNTSGHPGWINIHSAGTSFARESCDPAISILRLGPYGGSFGGYGRKRKASAEAK